MINGIELTLEITRKCNMQCPHCLRGDSQNRTITNELIGKCAVIFNDIGILTLTGGEPSLTPKSIEKIADCLDYNGWYVVTNGKFRMPDKDNDEIYTADYVFERWGAFIYSIWKLNNNAKDNDTSCLAFSGDMFHENRGKTGQKMLDSLSEFAEFADVNITDHSKHYNYNSVIGEGRGSDYNEEPDHNEMIMKKNSDAEYDPENDCFSQLMLYVNINGKCFLSCDFSYETQRKKEWQIGSVYEPEQLKKNLIAFCEKLKNKGD